MNIKTKDNSFTLTVSNNPSSNNVYNLVIESNKTKIQRLKDIVFKKYNTSVFEFNTIQDLLRLFNSFIVNRDENVVLNNVLECSCACSVLSFYRYNIFNYKLRNDSLFSMFKNKVVTDIIVSEEQLNALCNYLESMINIKLDFSNEFFQYKFDCIINARIEFHPLAIKEVESAHIYCDNQGLLREVKYNFVNNVYYYHCAFVYEKDNETIVEYLTFDIPDYVSDIREYEYQRLKKVETNLIIEQEKNRIKRELEIHHKNQTEKEVL